MKAAFSAFKDEITTIFSTRIAWLLLGTGLGSAGDAKSVLEVLMRLSGA